MKVEFAAPSLLEAECKTEGGKFISHPRYYGKGTDNVAVAVMQVKGGTDNKKLLTQCIVVVNGKTGKASILDRSDLTVAAIDKDNEEAPETPTPPPTPAPK